VRKLFWGCKYLYVLSEPPIAASHFGGINRLASCRATPPPESRTDARLMGNMLLCAAFAPVVLRSPGSFEGRRFVSDIDAKSVPCLFRTWISAGHCDASCRHTSQRAAIPASASPALREKRPFHVAHVAPRVATFMACRLYKGCGGSETSVS
jgi:hypothetical protein